KFFRRGVAVRATALGGRDSAEEWPYERQLLAVDAPPRSGRTSDSSWVSMFRRGAVVRATALGGLPARLGRAPDVAVEAAADQRVDHHDVPDLGARREQQRERHGGQVAALRG